MGALHAGHVSLIEAARAECSTGRHEPIRQPGPVRRGRRPRCLSARRGGGPGSCGRGRRRPRVRADGRGDVPARVPDLGRRDRARRDPRGRVPAGALPRRRDRLPQALHDRPSRPRLLRPEGRPAGRGPAPHDLRSRARPRAARPADRPGRRRPRALVPQPLLSPPSASRRWRCRGRSRPATPSAPASFSTGSRSTTSRSPRSTPLSSPPASTSAPPA